MGTNRQRVYRFSAISTVFLMFLSSLIWGQVQNGTVSGQVLDSAGAIVAGADVTLTSSATGLVLHNQTNDDGLYIFPQLTPGDYSVTVERAGFAKSTSTLTLTVGQTQNLNFHLAVGNSAETVTVSAGNAATLDSETSNLDYTVQARQVNQLPLNGRNPYGLAVLSPGVAPGANFGVGVTVAPGGVRISARRRMASRTSPRSP